MPKKLLAIALTGLLVSACSSSDPKVIEPSPDSPVLHLTRDMATQIEVPQSRGEVSSVVVGDASLVKVERTGNIISLAPKNDGGSTNLIVHTVDEDGHTKSYQYIIEVR